MSKPNNKDTDITIDAIYTFVDESMRHDKWMTLNSLYSYLTHRVKEMPVDVLVSYATASFPGKSKLPSRAKFMNKCKEVHPDEELWKGLE
jgi:hypothetical protein